MIKSKNLKCATEGCDRFHAPLSRMCMYHRAKDRASTGLKSSRISPVSAKKAKEPSLMQFYLKIWEEREHVSFISGLYIASFDIRCFGHILAKGANRYPGFKFLYDNVALLIPVEHSLFDQGTIEQRDRYQKETSSCDWTRLFDKRDELLKLYAVRDTIDSLVYFSE